MLRWGLVQGQGGRAPVWVRPRNKEVHAAAQTCCLLEHKQNSPKSVSGRYPGDNTGKWQNPWADDKPA